MRSLRITILGTGIGLAVGSISLTIAYAGLSLSAGQGALPLAMMVSAAAGSAAAGAGCVTPGCLLTGRERSLLAVLITAAVASLIVLPGNYANGSAVPPLIYAMAVLNGLAAARAVGPLCKPGAAADGRYLS